MLAAALNLPKWLLAVLVFGVMIGSFHQLECKLLGCSCVAVEAGAADHPGSPAGDGDCGCQCHVGGVATVELAPVFKALCFVQEVPVVERAVAAPEVLCAEIEYPPRLLCA